jgi:hypothetical protein
LGISPATVVVEGNTMTISVQKYKTFALTQITNTTQVNVSSYYYDGETASRDYLPAKDLFTAVMETGDIPDDLNDHTGTAALVDITRVSVSID